MTPMIVTNADGEKRRLSPFGIVGWKGGDVPDPAGGKVYQGTLIVTVGGPVGVRESEDVVDMLFELSTTDDDPIAYVARRSPAFGVGVTAQPPKRRTRKGPPS